MVIELSNVQEERFSKVAQRLGVEKEDAVRNGLCLLDLLSDYKDRGYEVYLINPDDFSDCYIVSKLTFNKLPN